MRGKANNNCRQNTSENRHRRNLNRRKRILRILIGVVLVGGVFAGGLWLAAHHVPGWYQPVYVPEARLDEVRADATRNYNRFGDGVVRRKPFDLTFDEHQVSAWIAARERIWPQSVDWIPAWLNDPIIRFQEGHIVVAARVEFEGYEFIAGAHLTIEVGNDDILVVRLVRVTIGSLPVPLGMLGGSLASLLRMEGCDPDFMPAPVADTAEYFRESEPTTVLSEGLRRANRFIWENGRRPYRIAGIKINNGKLTLTIEPLPQHKKSW